ncbi:MAG: anti-sigma regulatory factor [Candidatus Rokubacteria bacterium]|nr:anti-sigma regulatory factor [Candidatus Rokubacteria bacterium]
MTASLALPIADTSQVGEARRLATTLARRVEFDDTDAGRVSLAVTEAATNLVKHARGGEILMRALSVQEGGGIEILALDAGAGIRDVAACLRDGYSTAGSPGTGLGALMRLASVFDLYSLPGRGTAVLARIVRTPGPRPAAGSPIEFGVVCVPKPGEERSGDAWAVEPHAGGAAILMSDGLGHGPDAASASAVAIARFRSLGSSAPAAALSVIHEAMRPTRGAAVTVTEIDVSQQLVRHAGIGNIAGSVITPSAVRRMVSHNGIAGHEARRIGEFTYPWSDDAVLVLHSDGLNTHWDLDRYPGLTARRPSLVAGVLYRDFRRRRDDVAVLVVRGRRAGGAR